MCVVAMTQEMGSLAKDVALRLAERMQLTAVRHEIQDHVADRMQVSKSLIGRLRAGKAGLVERLTTDRRSVALYTAEELYALAARGQVVIRGWGATCLLRPVPHVVCVRITRPLEKRVAWLMEDLGTDDHDFAEAEVRRSDSAHASRMNDQFGVTWGDPVLYDLVLNTDRVSIDSCVEQIVALVGRPEFAPTDASRALLDGLALAARVRAAMKDDEATRDINVSISAEGRRVTLRGIVVSAEERSLAAARAARVPGVDEVVNELRLMSSSRLFASAKYT